MLSYSCQLYAVATVAFLLISLPQTELSSFRPALESNLLDRVHTVAAAICFAAFLFEVCFYFVLYRSGAGRVDAPQHGKENTRLMIAITFLLFLTYVAISLGYGVQTFTGASGTPRPMYSVRKAEWTCLVPMLMWIAGRPDPEQEEAKHGPWSVKTAMAATAAYCASSWLAQAAVDPSAQSLWLVVCLLGSILALLEQSAGARALQMSSNPRIRRQAGLMWYQVVTFIWYGVAYLCAYYEVVDPITEQISYTVLDVLTKLIHSWVLFGFRLFELTAAVTKAVAEARTKENDFRNLISNANAPIFLVDRDLKITSWNRKMVALTRIPQEATLGKPLMDFLIEGQAMAKEQIELSLKDEPTVPIEVDIKAADQPGDDDLPNVTKIVLSVTPKRNHEGTIQGVLCAGQDMTEVCSLKAEEARKAKFMAVVAHELRSPLHGIIGITDSLSDTEKEGMRKKQLGMVKNCAGRLLDLVVSIMDATSYMEQNSGRKAPRPLNRDQVELSKIVSEVVLLIGSSLDKSGQPLIRKGVSLLNTVQDDLPVIEADAHKCTQVFHNLLTNACKFTVQGRITIASNVDSHGDWVEVSISDTGKGIAPDALERIFKPFEQEEATEARKFEGIGLGLSIVKGVVEQHGGHVRVASEVGVGSTFTVRLPTRMQGNIRLHELDDDASSTTSAKNPHEHHYSHLHQRQPSSMDLPPLRSGMDSPMMMREPSSRLTRRVDFQVDSDAPRRRPTILSVDDDLVNQTVIESTLAGDYEIHAAMDGNEALEYLTSQKRLPDIVLLDVMMPGLTGFQVCHKIRNELGISAAALPVIMLSARSPVNDSVCEGLANGANDYLVKPFDKTVLHARVQSALNVKRQVEHEVDGAKQSELLRLMLPPHLVQRVEQGEELIAESHDSVTILVTDIVGWTSIKESMTTAQGISLLNALFCAFDDIVEQMGVHKVETVGDMYLCAAGHDGVKDHAERLARCGLELIKATKRIRPPVTGVQMQVRVGAHTGPAYTGVVGKKVPRYCFFGEALEVARRLEANGVAGCVLVSDSTRKAFPENIDLGAGVQVRERGLMQLKDSQVEMPVHLIVPPGVAELSPKRCPRKGSVCRIVVQGEGGAENAAPVEDDEKEEATAKAALLRELQESRAAAEAEVERLRAAQAADAARHRQEIDQERRRADTVRSELGEAKNAEAELRATAQKAREEAQADLRAGFERRLADAKAAAAQEAAALQRAAAEAEAEARRALAADAEAQRRRSAALLEELASSRRAVPPDAERAQRAAEDSLAALRVEHEALKSAHAHLESRLSTSAEPPMRLPPPLASTPPWAAAGTYAPAGQPSSSASGAPAPPSAPQEVEHLLRLYAAKDRELQHAQLELELYKRKAKAARAQLVNARAAMETRESDLAHALLGSSSGSVGSRLDIGQGPLYPYSVL